MSLDSYKFLDSPQPKRGPKAHAPVEMKEYIPLFQLRTWNCPVCGRYEERFKDDLPSGFIGITCAGDAIMEGVEG